MARTIKTGGRPAGKRREISPETREKLKKMREGAMKKMGAAAKAGAERRAHMMEKIEELRRRRFPEGGNGGTRHGNPFDFFRKPGKPEDGAGDGAQDAPSGDEK